MGKHTFYVILTLTAVWIILMENISWRTMGTGLLVVIIVMHFERKFLPYEEIKDVYFFKLATYPFFLIGQIYLSGWQVIKMVLTGCRIDVVKVKTPLKSETLRTILGDSITLIPGSVLLELEGNELTVLWIIPTNTPQLDEAGTDEMMKGKLERRLGIAQRHN
jgi:multisubunit Na+/H+ antiporter MnhE subunit